MPNETPEQEAIRRYKEELERITREREAAARFEWAPITATQMPNDNRTVYVDMADTVRYTIQGDWLIGGVEQAKEEEVSFLEGLETKETK